MKSVRDSNIGEEDAWPRHGGHAKRSSTRMDSLSAPPANSKRPACSTQSSAMADDPKSLDPRGGKETLLVQTRAMRAAGGTFISTPPLSMVRAMPSPTKVSNLLRAVAAPAAPRFPLAGSYPKHNAKTLVSGARAGSRATRTASRAKNSQNLLLALLSSPLPMRSLTLSLFGALCDIDTKLQLVCLCKSARHLFEDR